MALAASALSNPDTWPQIGSGLLGLARILAGPNPYAQQQVGIASDILGNLMMQRMLQQFFEEQQSKGGTTTASAESGQAAQSGQSGQQTSALAAPAAPGMTAPPTAGNLPKSLGVSELAQLRTSLADMLRNFL